MSDDIFHSDGDGSSNTSSLVPTSSTAQATPDYSATSPQDLEKQRLEGLAQEILELKLVFLSDAENFGREIDQLRRQVGSLTGLLVAAIAILAGTLTWLTFSLKSDQGQLSRQLEAIAADAVAIERIEQVETQLESFSESLPNSLAADVEMNQAQLATLEAQISELTTSVNTRRQTIAILAEALQDLINEEESNLQASPTPAASPATEASPES
ncbi:MAG: hypothetical protein HC840_31620 [Leptolyngbyaceae cyanobacterium RM2_2_4]|nr:hypothetical protein [Leptolyngbyaceae cyanobacterium SM1_4_3]NJN57571.1 hypothetical protein [Leptolyngbyaceae cyanobacterium SL_5_9]NJO53202.1 hypothetical protein [Leptolyngbyaceae cyanobacterium RM2_2_4]NJO75340.1 hypothetical protein [Leptolyngbyaceae cyanobacterium RM1_406_9]